MQSNDPKIILALQIISLVLFVIGIGLVWYFAHWAAALGVLLMILANNLKTASNLLSKVESLVITMRDAMDERYVQK